MSQITVITECSDCAETYRYEYAGVLVGESHALYVDAAYSLVVLERVRPQDGVYVTTGGTGSVIFDLQVADPSFIKRIGSMSAVDLLTQLITRN
ncbi:hypothetical protein [Paenibacillus ehimensis]|uniref:Uncharacterized protein n=1 Tax=Paenibacillus ehimensis TaxID=79264 RepID=A0ABT8VMJ9_9BACL|nr:hypothetical protein [Paenibacillus ehimensis]MDO3682212.1 hypothetical protein [Paenibacillus ehimensis]